jgi:hypothetical protein
VGRIGATERRTTDDNAWLIGRGLPMRAGSGAVAVCGLPGLGLAGASPTSRVGAPNGAGATIAASATRPADREDTVDACGQNINARCPQIAALREEVAAPHEPVPPTPTGGAHRCDGAAAWWGAT